MYRFDVFLIFIFHFFWLSTQVEIFISIWWGEGTKTQNEQYLMEWKEMSKYIINTQTDTGENHKNTIIIIIQSFIHLRKYTFFTAVAWYLSVKKNSELFLFIHLFPHGKSKRW